jgi:protein MpaA
MSLEWLRVHRDVNANRVTSSVVIVIRKPLTLLSITFALALMACGGSDDASTSTSPAASETLLPTTTMRSTTTITALTVTTPASTTPSSTTTTTVPSLDEITERSEVPTGVPVEFGRSVLDRPLEVIRRGDVDGARVLVVGCIHGDEDAGTAITRVLESIEVPAGVELWIVPTMNPDGTALDQRHNANGVDLNRNFGVNWAPLGEPGNWQYGGPDAASEPETQAMSRLGELVEPDLVLWYHQDLYRITPSSGLGGQLRARYAELTGLPLLQVTGGTYTGTASQWSRTVTTASGTGFTIELGASLSPDEAVMHAGAVVAVTLEYLAPAG